MPNITSVTNPVPGQENNTGYRSPITPNDTQIKNIPDPSRISRADQRTDRQDTASSGLPRRFDSYFQAFLQDLSVFGSVSDSIYQLLAGSLGASGAETSEISAALARLMQALQLSPEQLLALLKGQFSSGQRFRGPLFDVLRKALQTNPSAAMKEDVAQFLRKFSDFASTGHIERSLTRTIQQMSWFMPKRFSGALDGQLAQLDALLSQGDRAGALSLLRGTILPYMSDYVSQMHDRGIARNLLSMLLPTIAQYENGSPQNVLQSFYQLFSYTPVKKAFGEMSQEDILQMLRAHTAPPDEATTTLLDQLAALSSRAMRGEGSTAQQQAMQELMRSVLVNQSVFMPLAHAIIPAAMDGRAMFSELWVDADAEKPAGASGAGPAPIRLLLKFDIQELGGFDLLITYQDDSVGAELFCPPNLTPFTDIFETKLAKMAASAGLNPEAIRASPSARRVTLTQAFPKILERMNSVNVTI